MGQGPRTARLMLVGEAPGEVELARGTPFSGPAGSVLNIALRAAGINREGVYVTNTVKCMPPGLHGKGFRKPTELEVQFCADRWLNQELEEIKPRVVVALGETAASRLGMPIGSPITEWRGAILEYEP